MKKLLILCLIIIVFTACVTQTDPETFVRAETIVSIGPNITEILIALELGDSIVAMDNMSTDVPGVPQDIPLLDMMAIDIETILTLEPDIIIATEMITFGGDPLALVAQAGTQVLYVPVGYSLQCIDNAIMAVANEMQHHQRGVALATHVAQETANIQRIAETITERRTVYFEIDAAPNLFTFGNGTFLNEIIELIGATNIFADESSWIAVADEQILARNPDVILTNVFWAEDPIGDIKNRPGWDSVDAVMNGRVYSIDANASSRPSHNIVYAMWEMARAVYPEYF